jgi:RNA polymerase sigma factor (sigma-70 family)
LEIIFGINESRQVSLCKKGDAKAQYHLYKTYSKGMYNVAVRMTGDKETAEDILQDSFTRAFLEIQKLQDENAFGGWLKRIVINRCIDEMRKRKYYFTDFEIISEKHAEIADEVDETTDPELVHELIKKLPDGAREILVLHAIEGLKHAEIAEKLQISESTSKTQFFRAKQILASKINEIKNENGTEKISERKQIKA